MAKAITARRKGDDYQSQVFWLHLLQLRTGDFVDSVTLENDGVSFADDVDPVSVSLDAVQYQTIRTREKGLRMAQGRCHCPTRFKTFWP